jgi:quinol monooxygenase YgiN
MALGIYFTPTGFTTARYDEAIKQLEAAGAGAPAGRSYHVALETNGEISVFDIWESQEALEAFGATLGPIMAALGADAGEPMDSQVHNIIVG